MTTMFMRLRFYLSFRTFDATAFENVNPQSHAEQCHAFEQGSYFAIESRRSRTRISIHLERSSEHI